VTSHPTEANCHSWWLCCGKWRVLHAIPGGAISDEQMRDSIDVNEAIPARAACGLRRGWRMPGIMSRLGRPRCAACCRALGNPQGCGTPANEAARLERRALHEQSQLTQEIEQEQPHV
jgi:hypothetical protein